MLSDGQKWRELISEYRSLCNLQGHTPQSRGQRFNYMVASLLQCYGIEAEPSVRASGEIDVVFSANGLNFVLEAKWRTKKKADTGDLSKLQKRVRQRLSGTIGVFLSMAGYSPEALRDLSDGERLEVLLLSEVHWEAMLSGLIPPHEMLKAIHEQASFRGAVNVPVEDLFSRPTQPRSLTFGQNPGRAKDVMLSGIQGSSSEVIVSSIQATQFGVFSDGHEQFLITTDQGIWATDTKKRSVQLAVPLPDCHRNPIRLDDGSIIFTRKNGVGHFSNGKITALSGGSVEANGSLTVDPLGIPRMFDPGNPFNAAAAVSRIGSSLGEETWTSLQTGPGPATSLTWISPNEVLTIGNSGLTRTSLDSGRQTHSRARQSNPMGLVHLGSGVVASCGDGVAIGLTDTNTWEYCEAARLDLSGSIYEVAIDTDGCIFILSTYPAPEAGITLALIRVEIDDLVTEISSGDLSGYVKRLSSRPLRPSVDPEIAALSQLQLRISERTRESHRKSASEMDFRLDANIAFNSLKSRLDEVHGKLARYLEHFRSYYHGDISDALRELDNTRHPFASYSWGAQLIPPGGWPGPRVTAAIGMRVLDFGGPADIVGLLKVEYVHGNLADVHEVWKGNYVSIVGSGDHEQISSTIGSTMTHSIPKALQIVADLL